MDKNAQLAQRLQAAVKGEPSPEHASAAASNGFSHNRIRIALWDAEAPYSFTEEDLAQVFSCFGAVERVEVDFNGEGIVTLPSLAALEDAIKELNGLVVPALGHIVVEVDNGNPIGKVKEPARLSDEVQNLVAALREVPAASPAFDPIRGPPPGPLQAPAPIAPPPRPGADLSKSKLLAKMELIDCFGLEPAFGIAGRLLGEKNTNMLHILKECNHQIDIGIKGKASNTAERRERLHLTVSSTSPQAYDKAVGLVEDLTVSVFRDFIEFAAQRGSQAPPTLGLMRHEYLETEGNQPQYLGHTVIFPPPDPIPPY
uniref:RRM domain-containing protein n=1 Tax=Chromera velia CCMP2878 TaxID=1169474 RepID=A0A0G4IBU5_9ALVE|eukprot:Cvel_12938.t1-p1 / transcript=Cvel_12938.t1 / gene=Cvel_12938 / organism=Chromera_velia_CCMP2878 / gene_product=hypothetical protein / transcript_product=hypothetical protein / location=Cvel_scaffold865:51505-54487(+) / protein_length=313 / sequence_SO=supercontig / SO=protein_coding / is_pseudo=false